MSATKQAVALDVIWGWLAEVPDPEIPVISVVDLGIVRDVSWRGDALVVVITPTYSGCPAARVINEDIVSHLAERGIENVHMERQLSPAWRTAWLTPEGRDKLRDYGIAPPVEGTAPISMGLPAKKVIVCCPQCGSASTEKISQFGSTPCKASYRCKECLEPFDYFKCL